MARDTNEAPDLCGGKPCDGSGTSANLRVAREVTESQMEDTLREGNCLGLETKQEGLGGSPLISLQGQGQPEKARGLFGHSL